MNDGGMKRIRRMYRMSRRKQPGEADGYSNGPEPLGKDRKTEQGTEDDGGNLDQRKNRKKIRSSRNRS